MALSRDARIAKSWQELASKTHWPPIFRTKACAKIGKRPLQFEAAASDIRLQSVETLLVRGQGSSLPPDFFMVRGSSCPLSRNIKERTAGWNMHREFYTRLCCTIPKPGAASCLSK
jgi:hypothetical protein